MAEIVLGVGTSHSPMLTLGSEEWVHRAAADLASDALNRSDGSWISYADLLADTGPRYAEQASPQSLKALHGRCQVALDRLAADIERAAPDVLVIVGDDQGEMFGPDNQPMIALYFGDEVVTHDKFSDAELPAWTREMGSGYAMDRVYSFPGAPDLARDIIAGLIERDVDVATSSVIKDPHRAGFGHAFGFVIKRLLGNRPVPVIPLLLNTYYPPNVPTARRAHDFGRALREAIAASDSDLRVGVLASGGLSHFIVDEELDRKVIAALEPGREADLRTLPAGALMSGSSEILNWVLTSGAVDHLPLAWTEYLPIYRTPAGTGVGCGFALWAQSPG